MEEYTGINRALPMDEIDAAEYEKALAEAQRKALVLDPALYTPQLQKKVADIEKQLKNMQVEYVRIALLAAQGYAQAEIAAQTGLSAEQLAVVLKSKEYQAAVELLTRQVKYYAKSVLVTMVPRALNNLYALMESKNDKISLMATKEVLDRIGVKDMSEFVLAQEKGKATSNIAALTDEQLKAIIGGVDD